MKRILNRDYIKDGDYEVMTREFLISRGYCCQSGCRNCPYKKHNVRHDLEHSLKIVSLVPSWTETLLAANANVIGCTRFCIHPKEIVQDCIKLGGTKSLDFNKLKELQPDFVIMDKEENNKEMADNCSFSVLASHIRSLDDLHKELMIFSHQLNLPQLDLYAQRVQRIIHQGKKNPPKLKREFPGVLDWWQKPATDWNDYHLVYIIWKKPFMCVTRETYIGSTLSALGYGERLWAPSHRGLYPEFELSELPSNSILLFSSEPYPFANFKEEYLHSKNIYPAALVDGESFSWFGLRSIRFLEDHLIDND